MARIDRVERLRDLLHARERATVAELADELGASRRTILRDLAHLRDRGLPIEGEVGAGGGVRLVRDRGVASVHLATDEVTALWMAAALARRAAPLPWSRHASRALDKLLASLPRERARALRALVRRVVIGPPATASTAAGAGAASSEVVPCVEEALRRGVAMSFTYRDRAGKESRRVIEVHGVLVQPPVFYALGVDIGRREPRMFRMDRITRPAIVAERAFVPDLAIVEELARPVLDLRRSDLVTGAG